MNIIYTYALLVVVLLVLAALSALNFYRFRYKNDKTVLFIFMLFSTFFVDVILTLLFLRPAQ